MEILMEHLGHGLWISLLLSLPVVLLAAGIGLVVGILQAVTQVQEQTISAAPKILGVFMLLILGGGIMMNILTDYIRESVYLAFNAVPQSEDYILPPKPKTPNQQRVAGFFKNRENWMTPGKAKAFFNKPFSSSEGVNASTVILNSGTLSKPQASLSKKMTLQKESH